jgi:hypothetical protein
MSKRLPEKDWGIAEYAEYGAKVVYKNLPHKAKALVDFDDVRATANLAYLILTTDPKSTYKPEYPMKQAMVWKVGDMLKTQRYTCDSRASHDLDRPFSDYGKNEDGECEIHKYLTTVESKDERSIVDVLLDVDTLTVWERQWILHHYIYGMSWKKSRVRIGLTKRMSDSVSKTARAKMKLHLEAAICTGK